MVIIDIVSNTNLGGLTLDPAATHCPSWDDAFVSNFTGCFHLTTQMQYIRAKGKGG